MKHAASPTTGPDAAVYTRVVRATLAQSGHLLERVVESTRYLAGTRRPGAHPRENH